MSTKEFGERTAKGCGGYGLHYTTAAVYDCYKIRDVCMASMSNASRNVRHVVTGQFSHANARVRVDILRQSVRLVGTSIILPKVKIVVP